MTVTQGVTAVIDIRQKMTNRPTCKVLEGEREVPERASC